MDRVVKLIDDSSLTILPHTENTVYELYLKSVSFFWSINELDIASDVADLDKMPPQCARTLKEVLLFFVGVDSVININLQSRLLETASLVDKLFINFQMSMEDCHFLVYNTVFNTYYNVYKSEDIKSMLRLNTNILSQYAWALENCGDADKSLANVYLANALMEGLFLQNKFKFIFYLKFNGYCSGLAHINELILRDENLHLEFSKVKYMQLPEEERLLYDEVREIVGNAVANELEFWKYITPNVSGPDEGGGFFTFNNIQNDTWILANALMRSLGYEPFYKPTKSKMEYLNAVMVPMKTNYFERKDPEYQMAGNINFKFNM